MTRRRARNQQPARPWVVALVLVAIVAGLALGLALNRPVGTAPAAAPTGAIPTATDTPLARYDVGPPPLGATRNPRATLRLRFDVRDAETGQPVRATIWVGPYLVAKDTSLYEVEIKETRSAGAKYAPLKIKAPGYETWEKTLRFNVEYDRLIPLDVELQRQKPATGSGA